MSKTGAYGSSTAKDTAFRKEWNDEEYTNKAKEKDKELHDRAVENEEYLKQGKKPPRRAKEDLPKPTKLMQAREAPLELDKNLNKTIIINAVAGQGAGQPGFHCDVCRRTLKDSVAYLDHINGRSHLRRLSQTTKVKKSTLNDVRQKIAELRAKTAQSAESKKYDFDQRLKEIRELEKKSKAELVEKKRLKKLEAEKEKEKERMQGVDQNMMAAMGFAGFGTTAK
ncbi:BQ2448_1217 [Microbotryum intermedium]|uniref:BQ2448_1217 protein n=1 Tax=Microbotryum intermedium TaxID=269621 RepID=A0A238FCT6_9BASI|nr:BQ2448_1217 [Microbotryum intermedium]